jgi:hypothetical protein
MMIWWACDVILVPTCDNRAAPHPAERLERLMPDLPSGPVTFLFTDIEVSTGLYGPASSCRTQRGWPASPGHRSRRP